MMLDYAGELKLIEQVMAGADLHQATADMVGITRKQAKTLNFAILYGAGPAKLAGMLGITIAEAKYLMDKYFSRLPKVLAFKEQVVAKGAARGFVTNWFGRRCRIANREWAYVLPNHLIQGGCSDVIKIAMNKIDDLIVERGCKLRMRLTVHDELLLELPPNETDLLAPIVEIMENIYPAYNGMKLTTDVGHSFKSFSAKDKVKGFPA
jgi:DNA polymerase-1